MSETQDVSKNAAPLLPYRVWRYALLLFITLASLALVFSMAPFGQDPGYHDFGDRRAYFGIPNFFDVVSNLPFLLVGLAGIYLCIKINSPFFRVAWLVFFAGVTLVSAGSGYYHLNTTNETLVWDRLPMTIALMGLLAALLAEYVNAWFGRLILLPTVLMGLSSVLYWHWYDDLRFYVWIQFFPLLIIPFLMWLFQPGYTRQWLLAAALACYVLAKLFEACDHEVFTYTHGLLSGHSIKHLLAALGCLSVLAMLSTREVIRSAR